MAEGGLARLRATLTRAILIGIAGLLAPSLPARAGPAETDPDPVARAEQLATEAHQRYAAGEHAAAARLFVEAFELSKRPPQLHNAAKAFERAGLTDEALAVWDRYLALDELDEAKRAKAREQRDRLEKTRTPSLTPLDLDDRPRPPARGVDLVPAPPRPPLTPPLAVEGSRSPSLIAIGVGAALAAAGGILYASGWSTYWTYRSQALEGAVEITRNDADAARLRSGIGLAAAGAGAGVILAAFLLAAGDDGADQ